MVLKVALFISLFSVPKMSFLTLIKPDCVIFKMIYFEQIHNNFFLVIHCPALPALDNVIWSTYNTSVTVVVQALCSSSYQLSNLSVHELECTEAGEWSADPRTVICQSKCFSHLYCYWSTLVSVSCNQCTYSFCYPCYVASC